MLPDGRHIIGAVLQEMWRGMSFTFTSGVNYGSSRGGANDGGNVRMDAGVYASYESYYGPNAAAWLATHEMGHISDLDNWADRYWKSQHDSHTPDAKYDSSSMYFRNNEVYANKNAAVYLAILGYDPPKNPVFGYDYWGG